MNNQNCHWYGGCGRSKALDQFYSGIPGLCIECTENMSKSFGVSLQEVYMASFAIECGIKAEKNAHAKAMKISTEHAAAGTLRLDSAVPGGPESLRRLGMKSFLGALLKMTREEPMNYNRAREIHAKYQGWVDKKFKVENIA